MKDLSLIVNRNTKSLNLLLNDLKIEKTVDQLVQKFDSIFIQDDDKVSMRLRLLGTERIGEFNVKEEFDKEGNFIKVSQKEKKKQTQLYVLKKKDYLVTEESEKQYIISKFEVLIHLWKQLKAAYELQELEKNTEFLRHYSTNILEEIEFR